MPQEGAEKFQREGNTDMRVVEYVLEKRIISCLHDTPHGHACKKSAGALLLQQREPCGAQPGLHCVAHLGRIYGRRLGARPIPGHITMHAASERPKGR